MRVVTWNMHRATAPAHGAWEYLLDLEPDLVLLQEVGEIPLWVSSRFACAAERAIYRDGSMQRFHTAMLVRGQLGAPVDLVAAEAWVSEELARFRGNLVAHAVELSCGAEPNAVSLYNPHWSLELEHHGDIDTSAVRLAQQARDVWLADCLWSSLRLLLDDRPGGWIVGGDFNLAETFDEWPGGPHGNREYLERMSALGLVEGLRHSMGRAVPTFRNASDGQVLHQIDHLFVSADLARSLRSATTGDREQVLGARLSDHLPIIADFDLA